MRKLTLIAALLLASSLALAQSFGGTIFPLLARTATATGADITNAATKGAHVIITVTAYTSGNWTPTVQGKDPTSGNYYTILTGSAISGTGTTVLKVYPGITTAANTAVSDVLPRTWRVVLTGASTPISTFSVGYLSIY